MAEFPYRARAIMKFKSPPGSAPMSFSKGDDVFCTGKADDEGDWLNGLGSDGAAGVFPSAFVQRIEEDKEEPPAPSDAAPVAVNQQDEASASSTSPAIPEPTTETKAAPAQAPAISISETPKPAPIRQPSLPPAAANDSASSPPEPPKKPGSLRDRIAALNAAGAGAGGPAPPPIPRAKPVAFKRPSIPIAAPASAAAADAGSAQPSAYASSSSSPPEKSTIRGAMNAEDAKESIGKGGSLKDRIAALQNVTLDAPGAQGRAPKPWKKKSIEVEEGAPVTDSGESPTEPKPKTASATAGEDQNDQIKVGPPSETVTTISGREAETSQASPLSPAVESDSQAPLVSAPRVDEEDAPASPQAPQDSEETTAPVATTDNEPASDEDDESAKRSAIAARMAGLGGQRVGMAMPALPKRAGPPRRRGPAAAAVTPAEEPASPMVADSSKDVDAADVTAQPEEVLPSAPAPAPSEEIATPQTLDESTPLSDPTPTETGDSKPAQDEDDGLEREVAAPVTLGDSSLLANTQAEESEEDDFDTPALPKADSDDDFDTPSLPPISPIAPPQIRAFEDQSPETADDEQDEQDEQSEQAITPPPLPPGRPSAPPPHPPAQLSRDQLDDEQVDEHSPADGDEPSSKPDLSVETDDLQPQDVESTPVPTSPATASRPAIPAIPASFAAPAPAPERQPMVIPRSEPEVEEEELDVPAPLSPATASPPAIPGIPSSFASPTSPAPVKVLPFAPSSMQETETEEREDEDGQYASGTPTQSEAVDSPMDPDLPARAPPSMPKAMPPHLPVASSEPGDDDRVEEGGAEGQEDQDEDEEDPEVARRAALAARMAKLGGMNMRMGPMVGLPVGGMRPKKKSAPVESEAEERAPDESGEAPAPPRRLPGLPTGAFALPGITRPPPVAVEPEAEEKAIAEPPQAEEELRSGSVEETEDDVAPPPLPSGRPSSSLPPRRSIPTPAATHADADEIAAPSEQPPTSPQIASQFVEEPEERHEDFEQEEEMPPPPPPSRPAGGLPPVPSAAVASPPLPLPPTASPPNSPPSRRASIFGKSASKRESVSSLERAPTRTSMDSTRAAGGYIGDDATPQRTNSTSLPALAESSGPPPPSFAPAQLAQFSSTIGAQIFAAAHTKLNDKSAREQSGESLIGFCLSRATDPLPPRGWTFGASILELEGSSKGKANVLNEVDEPRAGDVIVFHDTKFKHNLSTSRVGSAERPFIAIVAAWDSKKRKVKTIEVASSGSVEEGAHRMEDLKSGKVAVWRVLPRDVV